MKKCIIQYSLIAFGGGKVCKHNEDIILFWDHLNDDEFFQHNSLNLTQLYKSWLQNGDKTIFNNFYFSAKVSNMILLNNEYLYVMEQIMESLDSKEKRSV